MSMQVIEHIEVGSGGAASIEFTSIPQTYTDLYLMLSGRSNASANYRPVVVRFNGSSTGYSERMLYGTGSSAASASQSSLEWFYITGNNDTANTFGNSSMLIPNYTSSNYKSISIDSVTENNATLALQNINAGLWSNTDAITSIVLTPQTGDFSQYSSATLYGITAGSDGTTTVS